MTQKDKVKELVGRGLGSYHTKALQQIDRIEKKNKEQSHKISILTNELDNDYLTKTEEGSVISLEHSKEGMVYIDGIEGNTLVNYCSDGAKELTLNGDIDVEGTNVTLTEGVDNGLVDVICEGNTMVNIASIGSEFSHKNLTDWYRDASLCEISSLKLNQDYTFIIEKEYLDNHNNNYNEFQLGIGNSINNTNAHPTMTVVSGNFRYNDDKIEKKVVVVRFTDFKNGVYLSCRPVRRNTTPVEGESANYHIKVIILEGDWTNKEIPAYFEGMKSVGECENNKFEILSRNNGNLFDKNDITLGAYLSRKNGTPAKQSNSCYCNKFIEVKENDIIYIHPQTVALIAIYDDNKNHIGEGYEGREPYTIQKGVKYIRVSFYNRNHLLDSDVLSVGFSNDTVVSKPYVLNKKEISLNEPLRGLPNGVKDKFIKQGSKWYIQRNVGVKKIDSTTSWNISGRQFENHSSYYTVIDSQKEGSTYLSESYSYIRNAYTDRLDTECITTNVGYGDKFLILNIRRNRLEVDNISEGLKKYLSNNPFNVLYELATPTYEEIKDVELITYLDTTHISNNSTIPCNMQVKNSGYNTIIKPSTQYTVVLDTNKNGTIGLNLGGAKVTTTNNVATITTLSTLTDDSLRLYGKGIKASKVRLLEGDKTNWIPSHFEGMKSSFEDKLQEDGTFKMEILSNNINLFNEDILQKINSSHYQIVIKDGRRCLYGERPSLLYRNRLTNQLKPNTSYTISFDMMFVREVGQAHGLAIGVMYTNGMSNTVYASSYNDWKNITLITPSDRTIAYIHLTYGTNTPTYIDLDSLIISETNSNDNYISHKSNKIQFSSIEPLRGIRDVKDRFVFKDGKLMIERNIKNIVFDGSQSGYYYARWYTDDSLVRVGILTNTSAVPKNKYNVAPISPQYLGYKWYTTIKHESIHIGGSSDIHFVLDSNRFKTKDLNGAKEFLSKNPIDVCYVLDEPTYEEIPFELQKIILEGYENGTLFLDTNIPPTVTTTYSGETPIVKETRLNKSEVLNNSNDINDNIVPYLMDMDYRVVCLQLEGGIENVSMARLFGGTYEMLQRDILSNRYSKEEYKYRLDAYLSANKITENEYEKLGDMLND